MSFFRRLTNLGRGALKARKQPERHLMQRSKRNWPMS